MKTVFTIFTLLSFFINFAQTEKFESFVDSIQKDFNIEISKEFNPAKKGYTDFFIKQLNKKVKTKIQYKSFQHVSYQLFNNGRNVQMDIIFLDLKNNKNIKEKIKGMFQTKIPYNFIYKKNKNEAYVLIVDFILKENDKFSQILEKRFNEFCRNLN